MKIQKTEKKREKTHTKNTKINYSKISNENYGCFASKMHTHLGLPINFVLSTQHVNPSLFSFFLFFFNLSDEGQRF